MIIGIVCCVGGAVLLCAAAFYLSCVIEDWIDRLPGDCVDFTAETCEGGRKCLTCSRHWTATQESRRGD